MEEAFQAGNTDIEPTVIHFNAVLDVHAKGPNFDKAQRAKRLFDRMCSLKRANAQPDIVTMNSLLRACANTFGSPEIKGAALDIASDVFKQILVSPTIKPSSVTFVFFFKVIRKLIPRDDDRRWKMLASSFDYCCKAGLLNDLVLQQVKMACSTEGELAALMRLERVLSNVKTSDLPAEWTKNACR
jgi:hypothetical protein